MSKRDRMLFVIFIALVVVFVIFNLQKNQNKGNQSQQSQKIESQDVSKSEKKENDEGEVVVVANPIVLELGENPKFELQFDTHSVDLAFDVSQITTLIDDNGNVFSQPQWDGSPSGGHHRSGTIVFDELLQETKSVELVIKDVAGIPERKFKWVIN